jgi:hypothetical protein
VKKVKNPAFVQGIWIKRRLLSNSDASPGQ